MKVSDLSDDIGATSDIQDFEVVIDTETEQCDVKAIRWDFEDKKMVIELGPERVEIENEG